MLLIMKWTYIGENIFYFYIYNEKIKQIFEKNLKIKKLICYALII